MFSAFTASSKVIVIICGTSDAVKFPGTSVPSFEHQQSGARQFLGSQGVALFGSFRASMKPVKKKGFLLHLNTQRCSSSLPHQPSSEPSGQSTLPSQKYVAGKHVPSPQAKCFSSQSPSSRSGLGGCVSVKRLKSFRSPPETNRYSLSGCRVRFVKKISWNLNRVYLTLHRSCRRSL